MAQPDARTNDLDRLVEKLAKLWFTINNPKADPDTPCVNPVAADFVGPAGTPLFKAGNIRPAWEFYLTKARGFAQGLQIDPEIRAMVAAIGILGAANSVDGLQPYTNRPIRRPVLPRRGW